MGQEEASAESGDWKGKLFQHEQIFCWLKEGKFINIALSNASRNMYSIQVLRSEVRHIWILINLPSLSHLYKDNVIFFTNRRAAKDIKRNSYMAVFSLFCIYLVMHFFFFVPSCFLPEVPQCPLLKRYIHAGLIAYFPTNKVLVFDEPNAPKHIIVSEGAIIF